MLNPKNVKITFHKILNSQGDFIIEALIYINELYSPIKISVPKGTSTGTKEPIQFTPNKTLQVIKQFNLKQFLLDALIDKISPRQFDSLLLKLDPSPQKTKLGGNTTLLLSVTYAVLMSLEQRLPLWKIIKDSYSLTNFNNSLEQTLILFNVVNGGAHGSGRLQIQEIKIAFKKQKTLYQQLDKATTFWKNLVTLANKRGYCTGVGKEGGLNLNTTETQAFDLIIDTANKLKLVPYKDYEILLDIAANDFYNQDTNLYYINNKGISSYQLRDLYLQWINKYPISGLEDPFAENDLSGWKLIPNTEAFQNLLITGDDITVSRASQILKYTEYKYMNNVIIKPNQTGTLLETANAITTAQDQKIGITVSHRSRETNSAWLSHIIAAINPPHIKVGNIVRGERVAKFNELLRILNNQSQDLFE